MKKKKKKNDSFVKKLLTHLFKRNLKLSQKRKATLNKISFKNNLINLLKLNKISINLINKLL